jgi:hypothetical protein
MLATLDRTLAVVGQKMASSGDTSYIPVLVELIPFQTGKQRRSTIASFLNKLLEGPDAIAVPPERADWGWWIEWLGNHPEVQAPEGFAGWKGQLYATVDPAMGAFLYDGVETRVRLEEVVWGGVGKDDIPSLNNPPAVPAGVATYLEPSDRIFGVSINGEHRAYPLRILNPHEMANDVVGGVAIALAY